MHTGCEINRSELIKRCILLVVGLFISAIGVAVTKKAELGVSPISSVANVMSIKFDFLSLGNWLIIWNCVLILGQIVLLRKNFHWIQLLQIPLSFLFGYFTDFGMFLVSKITLDSYVIRILFVILGTVILGFGIFLSVIANLIMNSGEAFVKAISDKTDFVFGNVKICFDISCVVIAVILSLVFFSFSIQGTREGTVIAAILTGSVVKFFNKVMKSPLEKLIEKNKEI